MTNKEQEKELRRLDKFNYCLVALSELSNLQIILSKRELKIRKQMEKYK